MWRRLRLLNKASQESYVIRVKYTQNKHSHLFQFRVQNKSRQNVSRTCETQSYRSFSPAQLNSEHWGLWNRDVLELFVWPKSVDDPYYEFQISPNGLIFQLQIKSPRKDYRYLDWREKKSFHATSQLSKNGIWWARMTLSKKIFGKKELHYNACSILGPEQSRSYWSLKALSELDFHRPKEAYKRID